MRASLQAAFQAGFTLIEVLITLVILSTGIVVVLQAFQTSATALGAARDTERATYLIQSTLDLIARDGVGAVAGESGCPPPFEAFQRRVLTGSTDSSGKGLTQITVEVWRQNSAVFSMSTYRYTR